MDKRIVYADGSSRVCCMATAKHAVIARSKVTDARIYSFYIDIRAAGKGYEEFVRRAIEKENIEFIKGRPSRVVEKNGKLVVRSEDAFLGRPIDGSLEDRIGQGKLLFRSDDRQNAVGVAGVDTMGHAVGHDPGNRCPSLPG